MLYVLVRAVNEIYENVNFNNKRLQFAVKQISVSRIEC